jgi:hypothetical protein
MDNRRPRQLIAAIWVAFRNHGRTGICAVSEAMERGFADFASVPYENPLSRQQWEELWETEAEPPQQPQI